MLPPLTTMLLEEPGETTCSAFATKSNPTSGDGPSCSVTPSTISDALSTTIVYALAISQTGKDPPDDDETLVFPITSDSQHFARTKSRIRSLDEATQAAIEKSQPYNRLKPGQWFMPLWWLAQLNNVDKHRLAHLAPIAAHHDEIVVDAEPGTFNAEWNDDTLVDGAPFFRLTLSGPGCVCGPQGHRCDSPQVRRCPTTWAPPDHAAHSSRGRVIQIGPHQARDSGRAALPLN